MCIVYLHCLTHSQFHQINLILPSRQDLLVEVEKSSKDSEFTAMVFVLSGLSKHFLKKLIHTCYNELISEYVPGNNNVNTVKFA